MSSDGTDLYKREDLIHSECYFTLMDNLYLETDLKGKVNNLPHFKNQALLPVFEAIVNSIHAIEDKKDTKRGKITVTIIRERDHPTTIDQIGTDLKKEVKDEELKILNFEIEDNGIGFTQENFKSFKTSDSTYKETRGGKGLGRFNWLKAFDKVEISSVYQDGSEKKIRLIDFSLNEGIVEKFNDSTSDSPKTKVTLIGFKEDYRKEESAYKTTQKIAQRILEHFLTYYIAEKAPQIIVKDENEKINLDGLYSDIKKHLSKTDVEILGRKFLLCHVKLYSTVKDLHNIVYCANDRDVDTSSLQKLLGTSALYEKNKKKFYYVAYVSGDYLDDIVNSTRTAFDFPKGDQQKLNGSNLVSKATLEKVITEKSEEYLSEYLLILKQQKNDLVSLYVSQKNPALRGVLNYCPEALEDIDPTSSDEKLDEILSKHYAKAQFSIRQQGKKILKTQPDSLQNVREESEKILKQLNTVNKDNLTQYIIHRKLIIDLLDKSLEAQKNGEYQNEDIIHDILFPRKTTSDRILYEDHNLWVIDDRLTFHQFAASDPTLCDISTSESGDRPDLIVFSEIDDDRSARSVAIFELKKPMRANPDDPVSQMYRYIQDIKDKKIKLENGRNLLVNEYTRFYCYAFCDINEKISKVIEFHDLKTLKDGLGYYVYNTKLNAYTELLAYDKVLADANKRHKIFFDKLGIQ